MQIENTKVTDTMVSVYNEKFENIGKMPLLAALKANIDGTYKNQILPIRDFVKSGDEKTVKKLKEQLVGFTTSGVFKGRRLVPNLETYNGCIILDFDHVLDNEEDWVDKVLPKAKKEPLIHGCFMSPSGTGFKCVIRTDSTAENHSSMSCQVKEYFEDLFGMEADPKCKDINRLCFFSYDPNGYINEESKIFNVVVLQMPKLVSQLGNNTKSSQEWDTYKFGWLINFTNNKEAFVSHNHNNYVYQLACNGNRKGVFEDELVNWVSNSNLNFGEEIYSTIHSAFEHHKDEFGKYPFVKKIGVTKKGSVPKTSSWTEDVEYAKASATQGPVFDKKSLSMSMSLREMKIRVESEPPIKMIWTPIKENSIGIVFGLAKTGKTTFCENLGMSIAAGRETFLDEKLNADNKKVLFISPEEFYAGRTNRNVTQLNEFTAEEQEAIMDNYIVVTENVPKVIQTKEDWEVVKELIRSNQPGIVFLDSLTRMVDDQIENSEIAKEAMLRIRGLAEEFKITVIVIHHSTKIDYNQPMTQQNVAGSRVVLQEVEFVIGINKTIDNQRYIKLVSARYADDNKDHVDLFELNENLHVKITGKAKEMQLLAGKTDGRVKADNRDIIYDYCIQFPERVFTTAELYEHFVEGNNKIMSPPTLHSSLDKLIAGGKMTKIKHREYRVVS